MNVDMNEICTNLVPYPRLHFLMTALSPQRAIPGDTGRLRYGDSSHGSPAGVTAAKGIIQRAFRYVLPRFH